MFHMGDDVKILAVTAASASAAVIAALLVARPIAVGVDRLRDASAALAARRSHRPRARERPGRAGRARALLQRDGGEPVAPLRRAPRARRLGEPRPAHAHRFLQAMLEAVEDGIAEPDRYLPAMREQVRILARLVEDLFELARIDAGALTLELREAELGRRSSSPASAGSRPRLLARHVQMEARRDGGAAGPLRAGEGRARALQPADERASAYSRRRFGRGARRARRRRRCR